MEEGEERDKGQSKIPTSKIKRAASIIGTSAKIGGNYIKYYAKKSVNPELSKETLHEDNAEDIYASLSKLKGSALKVAQMMSMDNQVLPKAYQDKFSLAQYNAPPLSYPLILKTFQQYFGKSPLDLFDEFSRNAVHAASIGQVHRAKKDGRELAVKIQYPGVADSITSDLKLVKPLASQLLNMKNADLKMYMDEVESKLLEETDYGLELHSGMDIAKGCAQIPGLRFPRYYPEMSNKRILTMDWIDGLMFPEFLKTNPSQEVCNQIGQAMWDFFLFQMKVLRKVHADPHPGNFIIDKDNTLCVLDFGCIKEIPSDFFDNYFQLLKSDIKLDQEHLLKIYHNLDLFKPEDTPREKEKLMEVYGHMVSTLALPFHSETFDFSNEVYFQEIFSLGNDIAQDKEIRKMNNARGSKHGIYVMRTFFGLYSLLHQLKATVKLNYTLD
jgi:predicted unusual protein kinase regulating ubiquinone biosynthesis (AarF/ABC1/UbiB family)